MRTLDRYSAFLHSDAWANHEHATRDVAGLFVPKPLPLGGQYYQVSRALITEEWQLPDFTRKAWWIRLQPDSTESAAQLEKLGLKLKKVASVQPHQTLVLDLKQDEETLLAAMKSKHRYNIRLAQKQGVTIEFVTENLMNSFERFWRLLEDTAERQTFRTHARSHYESLVRELEQAGMVFFVFARFEDRDIATGMIINYQGVGTYLHGGSSYADRQLMAPHLMHWETIRHLKSIGSDAYDFWGTNAVDGEPIPNHSSAGTTRFKLGFGGTIINYPDNVDIILNPFCYSIISVIKRLRSQKRAFS